MTVFYHGPDARITHEVFETRRPTYQLFPIRELAAIHITRERQRSLAGTPVGRAASLALVVTAIVAGAAAYWANGSTAVALTALLVTAISAAITAGCWHSPRNPYELRAIYRGKAVCLLRTPDERKLGQVRRGLLRALESREYAR
jgi:hypothetical protein